MAEQCHKLLPHTTTYLLILSEVRGDILKGPDHVLVGGQGARERTRRFTRQVQDAIVRRQHASIEEHHVLVLVIGTEIRDVTS